MTAPAGFGFVAAPYERTTSFIKGTAFGPDAVLRDWKRLGGEGGMPDPALTIQLSGRALAGPRSVIAAVRRATGHLLERGLLPILLGGEHTVTIGAYQAVARSGRPAGIVQLDAHADLRRRYQGRLYSHACVMRRLVDGFGAAVLPLGIRALSRREAHFMRRRSIDFLPGHRLKNWRKLLPPLLEALPSSVYLTVDMDFFDPAVVPGVGTPEPGGAEWYDALGIVDAILARKRLMALDVVELCPPREDGRSARAAVRLIRHVIRSVKI